MFVNNLNTAQQEHLLGLSKLLVSADGSVTKDESVMLDAIAAQCQVGISIAENPLGSLKKTFTDHASKVALLLELVGVAHADAEYHEDEQGLVRQVAEELEVSHVVLEDIENWVRRQFVLVHEAQTLMGV